MMQENRTFDEYLGMLNPYREANGYNVGADGNTYDIDGIDDKLTKFNNVTTRDSRSVCLSSRALVSTTIHRLGCKASAT
jgi:phospholipase C